MEHEQRRNNSHFRDRCGSFSSAADGAAATATAAAVPDNIRGWAISWEWSGSASGWTRWTAALQAASRKSAMRFRTRWRACRSRFVGRRISLQRTSRTYNQPKKATRCSQNSHSSSMSVSILTFQWPAIKNCRQTRNTKRAQKAMQRNHVDFVRKSTTRHWQDTPTTTKGGRSDVMPFWASKHIGGSRQGHSRYIHVREERPRVAHNTIHCATNVHYLKDRHHSLSLWTPHQTHSYVAFSHTIFCRLVQGSRFESSKSTGLVVSRKTVVLTFGTACRTRCRCFLHIWAVLRFPHALQSDFLSDYLPDFRCSPFRTEIYFAPLHRLYLSSSGWNAFACRLWSKRSHWRRRRHFYFVQTDVFSHTEYDVDLWVSWEHWDLFSWIGFWWGANAEYVGFTAVFTGEKASADRPRVCHSEKIQWQVHLTSEKVMRNLPQCCHTEERWVKRHVPAEKAFLSDISQFRENLKNCSGYLFRKLPDRFWKNKQIKKLQKQNLTSWSKNVKLISLNASIREFQRQSHSNRLEMGYVYYGYEESRREQARLHEDLVQREKALRAHRIRSIHEVEELRELRKCALTNSPGTH